MKWGGDLPGDYDDERNDPDAGREEYLYTGDFDQILDWLRSDDDRWERVVDQVHWDQALEWQKEGALWLQILNVVAEHDKEHVRQAVRERIGPTHDTRADLAEAELFSIGGAISALLESRRSPFAEHCQVGDDLEWVRGVVQVSRAFREVLFAVAGDAGVMDLRRPLGVLNAARSERGAPEVVSRRVGVKEVVFRQQRDPARTPLAVMLAEWGLEYLTTHRPQLNLAFCTECGRVYARERRDHVYCSKTCQNRVAYKRRRIFDAGVLRAVTVNPNAPDVLQPGLWLHHPRLGLGVVEAVTYEKRRLWIRLQNGTRFGERIPPGMSAERYLAQLKKSGRASEAVGWEETVDPHSLEAQVRFPHLVRTFSFSDLFAKRGESTASFYAVQDAKKFAELL
jgi:hypothetical protein